MKTSDKYVLHSRLIIIFILLLAKSFSLSAQSSGSTLPFLLNKGAGQLTNTTIVNDENFTNRDSIDIKNLHANQEVLYSNNKAYILFKGTGKVFEVDSLLNVTKIDNTIYGGHSFAATNFIYNDTIYSIGGYGFWNLNGAIRYLNKTTREWDVIRINKDISFANGINANSYLDKINGKLYLLYNQGHPEYVESKFEEAEKCFLAILDLKTKKWIETNYLINPQLAKAFSDLSFVQIIGDKILANSKYINRPLLIDIPNNHIQEVKEAKYTEWIQLKSQIDKGAIININDTVYLINKDTVYTFNISNSDLKPLSINIYEPIKESISTNTIVYIFFSIIIILLLGALFYNVNKLNTEQRKNKVEGEEIAGSEKRSMNEFYIGLSEIEKQTIELIVKNTWNGLTTSVNQINKILGTERKTGKVQNNIRGDIILELNNKFKAYTLLNDNIVERKKSEFDKRHIEYFISDNLITKFPKKLFD